MLTNGKLLDLFLFLLFFIKKIKHGLDGLSNISETNPEFKTDLQNPDEALSIRPSHASEAILEILASEPPNTVTVLALGPRT